MKIPLLFVFYTWYNFLGDMMKKKIRNLIFFIIELILIATIIFSAAKIVKWTINNKKNKEIVNKISKNINVIENDNEDKEDKYKIDFKNLKEQNNDVVAFIKVNGTNIEYPVVKGTDNSFYLNHSFDKSYNSFGWIFANYSNIFDGSDKNITLFGHAMRDGSMFGSLKNVLTDDWHNNTENLSIIFITEKETSLYQVFSTYKVEAESYYINNNFNSDEDYIDFLNKIKSRSNYDYNVDLTKDDQILTLSTCYTNNKYRIVLHAKKISE